MVKECPKVSNVDRPKCTKEGCGNKARIRGQDKYGYLCETCHRKKYPRNKGRNERQRSVRQMRRRGICKVMSRALAARVGNQCPICLHVVNELVLDHDHTTGRYRGMICRQCNAGVGLLKDDPKVCERAAKYLHNMRKSIAL